VVGFFRLRRLASGAVREVLQECIDRLLAGAAVEQGMTVGWPSLGEWLDGQAMDANVGTGVPGRQKFLRHVVVIRLFLRRWSTHFRVRSVGGWVIFFDEILCAEAAFIRAAAVIP
jgi:hypothetical protein